ncbi:MAG: Fic family protein [Saprospiraceae bacterium]
MKTLLKELDAKKAVLATLQPMKPADAERLWKKFRLEWNYNSNHIEGNNLTYQETELMLIFDQAPTGNHTVREIEEMKAHDVAIELVREWAAGKTRIISESDIRSLNKTLLVRPFWNDPMTPDGQPTRRLISIGEYKKHPNSVRLSNGEMFHYASPEETPLKMDELLTWYRQAAQELHPAIVAAKLHYDFVRIHPFDDGNGRVSRLLMNYHLLRYGFPPVIIKSDDKKNYLAALNRADVGDFEAFAMYVAEQVLWSLELSISAAKGESVEEEGDWEKELSILEHSMSRDAPLVKEISNDLAFERMKDSIIPFFNLLHEKTLRFDKFFDKATKAANCRLSDGHFQEFYINDIEQTFSNFHIQNRLGTIQIFDINFRWHGFLKNPTPANDIVFGVKIEFERYQYQIQFYTIQKDLFKGNHTVSITTKQQSQMAGIVGKYLVEKLSSLE